jgi:hypothetical protein
MRPGGGKDKGSAFERKVGAVLSLWLTGGARADVFARNVLSGGKFTIAARKGQETSIPGDLMAAHPQAFAFLALCSVECKHRRDLELSRLLFDGAQAYLSRVLEVARQQAARVGCFALVIAKQNHVPAVVLTERRVGDALRAAYFPAGRLRYHLLRNETVFLCSLQSLLATDAEALLVYLKQARSAETA